VGVVENGGKNGKKIYGFWKEEGIGLFYFEE
jgi:hypothetical protein